MSRGRALGPGSLTKRNGAYVLDWTNATGERRRQSLGENKGVAERRRMEMIRRRDMELDGLGAISGMDLMLSEIVPDYLADLETRVSRHHYRNVAGKLDIVLAEFGETRVRDLKPMELVRFRTALSKGGKSNRTANLFVDNLRSALTWAVECGYIATNPLEHLKRLPTIGFEKCRRRAMTEDEVARFLGAVVEDDERCEILAPDVRIPQLPLFRTLLETGGRYAETTKLAWGDVDFAKQLLVLRAENTKSKRQRVIPLTRDLTEALRSLRVLHESRFGRLSRADERVFLTPDGAHWPWHTGNIRRIFMRVLEAAGIQRIDVQGEKIDLHGLRHTAATRLARAGVPLVHTQRILGHADPKLTAAIYTHIGVEDLRGAVEAVEANSTRESNASKEAAS